MLEGSGYLETTGTNFLGNSPNYVIYSTEPQQSWQYSDEPVVSWGITKAGRGISPILYFKYIKTKFNFFQKQKIDKRLKDLEKAFNEAVENGQTVLAEKFLAEIDVCAKETLLLAKGLKYYIHREDLMKYKNNINGGHISDTEFSRYTRHIPKRVIDQKKKYEGIFNSYEIWHYFSEKQADVKKMTPDEKTKMKDPILFGKLKGTDKMYFIADWEDEYCDLTFDDLIKVMGKDKKFKIEEKVKLNGTSS